MHADMAAALHTLSNMCSAPGSLSVVAFGCVDSYWYHWRCPAKHIGYIPASTLAHCYKKLKTLFPDPTGWHNRMSCAATLSRADLLRASEHYPWMWSLCWSNLPELWISLRQGTGTCDRSKCCGWQLHNSNSCTVNR